MAPTIPGFQGIKRYIQYFDSHPHKPIFYPSNSHDGLNFIRVTWSGNKVEYYRTHYCLEWYQDADHARIINRGKLGLGIIHTLLGVSVWQKVQIKADIASESTDGEIRCM